MNPCPLTSLAEAAACCHRTEAAGWLESSWSLMLFRDYTWTSGALDPEIVSFSVLWGLSFLLYGYGLCIYWLDV